jgi:hypothetical protein
MAVRSVLRAGRPLPPGRFLGVIESDVEGTGRDIIWRTTPVFASTDWGEPREISLKVVVLAEIRTGHLPNTNLNLFTDGVNNGHLQTQPLTEMRAADV